MIMSIDCGSTMVKASLFSSSLERMGEGSMAVKYEKHDDPMVEFDGEVYRDRFIEVFLHACRDAGVASEDVSQVALTSQAQTFAVMDEKGNPTTPFYSWLDRRAEEESAILRRELGENFHRHCGFSSPLPQLQICKMFWLQRHESEHLAKGNIVTLPGYLASCLGAANQVDRNLAAMSGAYSLEMKCWWPAALRVCGLAVEKMPRLVEMGEAVSSVRKSSISAIRPRSIVYAGNDQSAGAVGNGCRRGSVLLTLGTALVVYRVVGNVAGPYHEGSCWGPYPGASYYELATMDEGCHALDWARNHLDATLSPAAFDALAQNVVRQRRQGEAPLFYPNAMGNSGAWLGEGDVALKAYAVLEGIVFSVRRLLYENLSLESKPEVLTVVGGGSKSAVWLQLFADALACPMQRGRGDASLGAAVLARNAAGIEVENGNGRMDVIMPCTARRDLLERRFAQWSEA